MFICYSSCTIRSSCPLFSIWMEIMFQQYMLSVIYIFGRKLMYLYRNQKRELMPPKTKPRRFLPLILSSLSLFSYFMTSWFSKICCLPIIWLTNSNWLLILFKVIFIFFPSNNSLIIAFLTWGKMQLMPSFLLFSRSRFFLGSIPWASLMQSILYDCRYSSASTLFFCSRNFFEYGCES